MALPVADIIGQMLSVIIPSYKDPLLHKTIDSLLENAEGEIEIIVVLDGFWPETPIKNDERIRVLHLGKNRGMRGAINAGVDVARGEFLLRSDQHCMFAKGFDRILTATCEPNWIVTATRYFLDPVKWEVMDIPPVNYEKLVIQGDIKFSGQRWKERDEERKDIMIDETMAMQGSMWMMPTSWWKKVIKELQTEGYGQMYQDSHEMIFKTWKAGGKMMLNKNTWFAHKHRSFIEGRHEGTEENSSLRGQSGLYALSIWRDYYEKEIRPQWEFPTPLCEIGFKYRTDKTPLIKQNYTPFYYHLLKDKPIRKLLEVGVGCPETMEIRNYRTGASLYMWRDFFPGAQIYGADINAQCIFKDERIETFLCDETKEEDLVNLIKKTGPDIDLFIDDASHLEEHQKYMCQTLMPLLKKDVMYIIEDVNYSPEHLIADLGKYDCEIHNMHRARYNERLIIVKNR